MTFRLIDKVEEDIVNASSNGSTKIEEFAVNSMQSRLEEVTLARIFRIEEFEEVEDEGLVDISFGKVGVKIGAFYETEEEFIDNLEMRPREFEYRLIFFRVISITCGVDRWGYRTEEVGGKLRERSGAT